MSLIVCRPSQPGRSGAGGGRAAPTKVTPNSSANAWAMSRTPISSPSPYRSDAKYGVMASRIRPVRASGRNPSAPRPVAMKTFPEPGR